MHQTAKGKNSWCGLDFLLMNIKLCRSPIQHAENFLSNSGVHLVILAAIFYVKKFRDREPN